MNRLLASVSVSFLAVSLFAGSAAAQQSGGAAPYVRDWLTIGASVGAGSIRCDTCDSGIDTLGLELHVGKMFGSRLGVMVEAWGMAHTEELDSGGELDSLQVFAGVGAQYWLLPRLWAKGAIGLARLSATLQVSSNRTTDNSNGLGFMGALGYEVFTTRRLALDVQLRAGYANYNDSDRATPQPDRTAFAVGLGVTWF